MRRSNPHATTAILKAVNKSMSLRLWVIGHASRTHHFRNIPRNSNAMSSEATGEFDIKRIWQLRLVSRNGVDFRVWPLHWKMNYYRSILNPRHTDVCDYISDLFKTTASVLGRASGLKIGERAFSVAAPRIWIQLTKEIKPQQTV